MGCAVPKNLIAKFAESHIVYDFSYANICFLVVRLSLLVDREDVYEHQLLPNSFNFLYLRLNPSNFKYSIPP